MIEMFKTYGFNHQKILVIGDIMLDRYVWGEVSRISPEAPVPIILKKEEKLILGGASNVVNNIHNLGAAPILCGVVGADTSAGHIITTIDSMKVPIEGIIVDSSRPTTVKWRVIGNTQQVARIDEESSEPVGQKTTERILDFVKSVIDKVDAIIISDYGKGVVSRKLIYELRDISKDIIITVDPKVGNFKFYKGVTCITPNHHEAGEFCGFNIVNERTLNLAGKHIIDKLGCESVLITQGKEGMTLFESDASMTHFDARVKQVFDVSGAGDTAIAVFTVALSKGLSIKDSVNVSNIAAGIVVTEPGTSVITIDKLIKELKNE